jgi:hypothetical protein
MLMSAMLIRYWLLEQLLRNKGVGRARGTAGEGRGGQGRGGQGRGGQGRGGEGKEQQQAAT